MHLDAYLEPCAAYGWEGGPQFRTNIVELQNGDEYRNADWIEARHVYSAPFQNITPEAYRALKRMFYVCRGMAYAFRFKDELDYQATNEIFGAGDASTTGFQLAKISTEDGVSYTRNVYALRSTPIITVNGVPTTAFDLNPRTGAIDFDVAPANGAVLRWTGEFDVWVRFATDFLRFSLDNLQATNGAVEVIEVPPPAEVVT
jgi:uncharacterized protein (TIGR02217 family)